MPNPPSWVHLPLEALDPEQWEALCDGCGLCCLHKLEDEDDGEVYYTNVCCRLLDPETAKCGDYTHRKTLVPDCLVLDKSTVAEFDWLPQTCAYRLRHEHKPLPVWHPLMTGNPHSTQTHGASVVGKVIPETHVNTDDMEDHIIHWVDID